MRFLDTNVILDLFGRHDGAGVRWSNAQYGNAVEAGAVCCNVIVLAELSSRVAMLDKLIARLKQFEIDLVDFGNEAAFRAGQAFGVYRRRGGARTTILPDFLIAAHAETLGTELVTRDRRLASYFPDLTLITPETHP